VESTGGDYNHYYDGITPSVGRLIDALDAERIAVAAGLDVAIEPLAEFFFRMGYTNAAGRDGGTAYDVFHNSAPNRGIKAPATIDHRFLNEDVPFGLVAIAELGRAAGIPTPCADAVIDIASIVAARPFRRDGLTRERMGIGGMTAAEVTTLLRTGKAP
jgi:opine dehydrogenase